ncbi:MAG: RluA family pseudouridine synthase [Rhodospirillales bacterium]|nr:RluA family pseudouridine synthase [Rhodospirillales bacterium]
MTGVQTIEVASDEADQRLDRWFKRRFPELKHGRLEKLLRTGQIRVDGKRAGASLRLVAGQMVRVPPNIAAPPAGGDAPPPAARAERPPVPAGDAKLVQSLVIHRDDDVIAINKPYGLAVQGGTGTKRHLDGMLDALRFGAPDRPRLVHRLDRDTSGVLLLARNARAAAWLAGSFRHKLARKLYWALVGGAPRPAQGKIDLALAKEAGPSGIERVAAAAEDGQRAITLYATVEATGNRAAWLVLWPLTGRTHQLRVHCAEALQTPIVGDGKYGGAGARVLGAEITPKLHLHARRIVLPHPSGAGVLRVEADLPAHMRESWDFFGFDANADIDPFPGE